MYRSTELGKFRARFLFCTPSITFRTVPAVCFNKYSRLAHISPAASDASNASICLADLALSEGLVQFRYSSS